VSLIKHAAITRNWQGKEAEGERTANIEQPFENESPSVAMLTENAQNRDPRQNLPPESAWLLLRKHRIVTDANTVLFAQCRYG